MSEVFDMLTEEESYLWAIMSDPSGLDGAEFCVLDETNDKEKPSEGKDGSYCFRAWPFQWPWWRCMDTRQIEQGSRSAGKSMSIRFRALAFPFCHAGSEMVITAPEGVHLDAITKVIETMFMNNTVLKSMLLKGRGAFGHRPFHVAFQNGAQILGRIPHHDGSGVKGIHPLWLEMDEASDYPEPGWKEIIETLKSGDADAQWRAHGVTRGMQDSFYEYTQPGSGWTVHHIPAMYRPTWSDEERADKIMLYGSADAPDYRRNILGLHGDAMSPLFVLHRLMECVDRKEDKDGRLSDYNTVDYYNLRIDEGTIRYHDDDIIGLFNPPATHLSKWKSFWIGMDIGMAVDPTVIVVFAEEHRTKTGPSSLKLIAKLTLVRVGAPDQHKIVLHLCNFYKPHAFTLDSTGVGLPILQMLQDEARQTDEEGKMAQRALNAIKGYNFSQKIVVDFDDSIEVDDWDPNALQKTEIRRLVKDYATDQLRILVDEARLTLPFDKAVIAEFQGQSVGVKKDALDHYGRKRNYSTGYFHTLDATRMAVLGWKQHAIETFLKDQENTFTPVAPIFITG